MITLRFELIRTQSVAGMTSDLLLRTCIWVAAALFFSAPRLFYDISALREVWLGLHSIHDSMNHPSVNDAAMKIHILSKSIQNSYKIDLFRD